MWLAPQSRQTTDRLQPQQNKMAALLTLVNTHKWQMGFSNMTIVLIVENCTALTWSVYSVQSKCKAHGKTLQHRAQKSRKEETDGVLWPIKARQRTYVCSRYSMWPHTRYLRYFTLIGEMDCKVADQDTSKKNIHTQVTYSKQNSSILLQIKRNFEV